MKNFLLCSAILAIAFGLNASAQDLSTADEGSQYDSSFDISYQAIDNGFGMGMTWVFNHFVINGSLLSGKTDKYITKNEAWRVGIGGNYRYWLAKPLYIEGQAGVEYSHSTVEYKVNGSKEKNSDGNVGMFLTPRVGLKLFTLWDTNWGIVAGYRWDFNKFKFDKDYTDKYFTIGISAIM